MRNQAEKYRTVSQEEIGQERLSTWNQTAKEWCGQHQAEQSTGLLHRILGMENNGRGAFVSSLATASGPWKVCLSLPVVPMAFLLII